MFSKIVMHGFLPASKSNKNGQITKAKTQSVRFSCRQYLQCVPEAQRTTELTEELLTEAKIVALSRAKNKMPELHRAFNQSASLVVLDELANI